MKKDITVVAQLRTTRGKNEARRLRARGLIPAVLYGAGKEPVAIAADPRDFLKILHSPSGHNTIFTLAVDGVETTLAMIVDWQLEPVKDTLLHVDLKRIDPNKRVRVTIPVHPEGTPVGVKDQGGLLELVLREVEVECLPDEIPEHLNVDVTRLRLGQVLRASEIPLTGSMRLVTPGDAVVAHVITLRHAPAQAAEVPAEGEAAPAEPEVIKKGKKEEGEEAEEKGKKK